MVDTLTSGKAFPAENHQLTELTFREWEVLLMIAEDKTSREIAALANLKPNTISTMRHRIGDKLMLKGHNKLAHYARKHRQALHELFPILYPPRNAHKKKSGDEK